MLAINSSAAQTAVFPKDFDCSFLGEYDYCATVLDGNFAFRLKKDGTAQFDWFRSRYDHYEVSHTEVLEIPEQILNHKITCVLSPVCEEFPYIRKVILPKHICSFQNNPFETCPNLEEIIVSSENPYLTTENNLLISKVKKKVVCCPPGEKKKNILIPDWVTSIGPDAFSNCHNLFHIYLPESITEIEECAFSGCSSLKTIYIPSKIETIPDYTFNECSSLEQITLPERLRSIGTMSFASCSKLISVQLPDSVENFGCYSFLGCNALVRINLPLHLKEIDLPPFMQCDRLLEIVVPSQQKTFCMAGNLLINQVLDEVVCCIPGLQTKELTISANVKRIGAFAFCGLNLIQNLHLPEGIESIDDSAFFECHELRTVHLPRSLERLGSSVFLGCHKLKYINLPHNIQYFGSGAIYKMNYLTAWVEKKSAAREYCLQNKIPYHIIKKKRLKTK